MIKLQRLSLYGSTPKANVGGSGRHPVYLDDDIVCSLWKHKAELKARLLELRLIMNIQDFSTVISTKKMPIKKLKDYENDLLNITPEEEALGFKYVFQTMLTKETVNERIRSPLKMWTKNETYIDNNIQLVVDRLHEYYDN